MSGGTHYVGDSCPGGHEDAVPGWRIVDGDEDGHGAADGRRLLARFYLPLNMRVTAKALLLFASAYPHAVLDNPADDSTVVDIYDRAADQQT